VRSVRVPGFLPSRRGLHFPNRFPRAPVLELRLGPVGLPVGDAADGLCGGMVFAVRDLFEAGRLPPERRDPPPSGSPLFRYLVRRLFASFDLPWGPLRYLLWQALPTADGPFGLPGLWRRTARREWPKVRADLEAGRLSPLGLVRPRSLNPLVVGRNHQVLAYGYDLDEERGRVAVLVYDPNHPDEDGLALTLDLTGRDLRIGYVPGEAPVRGFFRTPYRGVRPPPDL
jgi:hypothetical protein